MKKTNTINLGGIIFHVDEDAFTQLQNYLNAIRSYFPKSDGQEEIIADIESRIAEIFQEKKISIITIAQVDDVIAIMGKPEDYGDGEHDEKITKPHEKKQRIRKIFRHPDDKILGGVCGGLGAYFNVDPVLFRLRILIDNVYWRFWIFCLSHSLGHCAPGRQGIRPFGNAWRTSNGWNHWPGCGFKD